MSPRKRELPDLLVRAQAVAQMLCFRQPSAITACADMSNPFEGDGPFLVLVNDEGQYSLWPQFIDVPAGWRQTGSQGDRDTCLKWIEQTWTDMRPLSLVRQMEEDARA